MRRLLATWNLLKTNSRLSERKYHQIQQKKLKIILMKPRAI